MKHPRVHNEKHLAHIRTLLCCVCGNITSVEAAHIRLPDLKVGKRMPGLGEKPDDCWVVPLCSGCHRQQHSMSETKFWGDRDPLRLAMALFIASGDHERGEKIVMANLD